MRQGHQTGLPLETLQAVGEQLTAAQPHMALHREVRALLERRRRMVGGMDSRVDFAFSELLAFGTLSLRRPIGARPLLIFATFCCRLQWT
jgi:2-oxoglutarate dehydrogenase complex dehydrogenase (E1) component-like enzyme